MLKTITFSVLLIVLSLAIGLGAAETILRIKNSSMKNYDIEMWKYAKELKFASDNPLLGHEHVKSASALLQSVTIRTNEWGLRGPDLPPAVPGKRRILFLGSSITLGWGVPEEETLTALIQKKFEQEHKPVEVLNAGIGNYNTLRYVERFMTRLQPLQPTDIVVHFFLRDAEVLTSGGGNFLLRNSQVAVTVWTLMNQILGKTGEASLVDHYAKVYDPNAPGFLEMKRNLKRLADYAHANNIRIYLAMTPDVHNLSDYKFNDIHALMQSISNGDGYTFIDLYPAFKGLTPRDVWAMPGDPHPNALGHRLMAEAIFPVLDAAAN